MSDRTKSWAPVNWCTLTWTSRRTQAVRACIAQDRLQKFQDRTSIVFASLGIVLGQFESLGTVLVLASKFKDG